MDNKIIEFIEELKFDIENIGSDLIPPEKRNVIFGVGNFNAPIVFVADDENLYKNENGEVENLSTGEFLIKLLDLEDISVDNYYITTLTKRGVRFSIFTKENKNDLKEILETQISLIYPKIIVTLGNEAFSVFFPNKKYEDCLGKFLEWRAGTKILVTYDIETVMKARSDQGKKSIIAKKFWTAIKNLKACLESLKSIDEN